MTAEKFLWAFLKSEVLMPKTLDFGNTNMYVTMIRDAREQKKRESKRSYRLKMKMLDCITERRRKHDKDTD